MRYFLFLILVAACLLLKALLASPEPSVGGAVAGCGVNCKDPANAQSAQCKLQQGTIDCGKVASGISDPQGLASKIFIILAENGLNYMADIAALLVGAGESVVNFVVCEVKAVDDYFAAITSKGVDGGAPSPLKLKLVAKASIVQTRAAEVIAKYAPGKQLVGVEKMPIVVH